jgi:hypothetical protein
MRCRFPLTMLQPSSLHSTAAISCFDNFPLLIGPPVPSGTFSLVDPSSCAVAFPQANPTVLQRFSYALDTGHQCLHRRTTRRHRHAAKQEANATMAYFSIASRAMRQSVWVRSLLPGRFGHAVLRHFLFDAGEGLFVEFFFGLVLAHIGRMSSRAKQYSSI